MSELRFRANSPDVVSETIEGEAVIIHLYKGHYYNLNPIGAKIWNYLIQGLTSAEMSNVLSQHYAVDLTQLQAGIEQLQDQLQAEDLIVALDSPMPNPEIGANTTAANAGNLPFEMPKLNKYTDMQDLLALDPIHDVDEAGWPAKRLDMVAQ
jgi:Coenzyme PQQ synthesis protein D (PqqD)